MGDDDMLLSLCASRVEKKTEKFEIEMPIKK